MLELKDVSFSVKGVKMPILDHLSLKVPEHSLTVITGPNGSGKSTLGRVIIGLKRPTAGQITFNHQDITNLSITDRAKLGLAFSFQQPVKFKGLTVFELLNIANGELMGAQQAGKILQKVGLAPDEYLSREINDKLSGGELKRIEIASVLARNVEFMLFDEPEAGIDLWSFGKLAQVFQKLHSKGRTIVIISHQERLMRIADQIVVMAHGQIRAKGAPDIILPKITGGEL